MELEHDPVPFVLAYAPRRIGRGNDHQQTNLYRSVHGALALYIVCVVHQDYLDVAQLLLIKNIHTDAISQKKGKEKIV